MSDIGNRNDLINQLRVALRPEEFKKLNLEELSDAKLQLKLNKVLTNNQNWGNVGDNLDIGNATVKLNQQKPILPQTTPEQTIPQK